MLRARHAPPIERELKFSLPAHGARRVWRLVRTAAPAQRRALDSVYFDTPERKLHRRGVALRLRRERGRWLQTIKSAPDASGGLAARMECEVPAAPGRLDCSRFPRAQARIAAGFDLERIARALRPLFRTRFVRTSGTVALGAGARAEISLDRGSIEANGRRLPIHELELELQQGSSVPMLRLAESLVEPLGLALEFESKAERGYRLADGAAGVAPRKWPKLRLPESATAGEAFAAVCGAALGQIGVNARGYATAADPEHLHQLRVGVRRLRSALRAFRRLLRARKARGVDRAARRVMRTLGPARDADVFCEALAAWVRRGRGDPEDGRRRLLRGAQGRRTAARRAARRLIAGARFQRFQLSALRWLESGPWKPGGVSDEPLIAFGARALDRLYRKTVAQAEVTDWGDAARRHALRVALKRLRYGCDYFAGCFARNATRPYLKRLVALQDILGELNDLAVARQRLRELAPRGSERSLLEASRRIRRRLVAQEQKLIAALPEAWDALVAERPFWRSRKARRALG